jgi:CubicO group peptidase (beta-lactamase class C family)
VVVTVRDEVVLERYFRDRRPNDLANLHSVTKSVVSTLAGIALRQGKLELESRVAELLALDVDDARKRDITVEHLLTMTSGLDADGPHDIDEIADRGESWLAGPLDAPLRAEPGTMFIYNNGAVHLLGAVLAHVTGMQLAQLAAEELFAPLDIDEHRWPVDPEGRALAYGHLELRPRDLARLGELYLRDGHSGRSRLLEPAYVDAATTASTEGGPPEGRPYGYLWWIEDDGSYFAGGYAGQYLIVVPALEAVIVTTADAAVYIQSSRSTRRLVQDVVLPTLAAALRG